RLLLARRGNAEHFALSGRERDHDEVVLVGAERRLSLGGENADHAQWNALDLNQRADRAFVCREQLPYNGLTEYRHQRSAIVVLRQNAASFGDLPIRDGRIVGTDALNVGGPILITILRLPHLPDEVADAGNSGRFAAQYFGIVDCECGSAAKSAACTAHRAGAGNDNQEIGAQALYLLEHGLICTLADGDHRDEGCDADEHA